MAQHLKDHANVSAIHAADLENHREAETQFSHGMDRSHHFPGPGIKICLFFVL